MNNEDCLELVLDDCVRVDFIPLDKCKLPVPVVLPNLAEIVSPDFGTPLLTLDMANEGDGEMDSAPTLQIKDADNIYGRTRQHTLQCVVDNHFPDVRKKSASLANIDVLPLFTYADGSQRVILPLPNTSNFTFTEQTGSLTHTATVQLVVSSMSYLVEID